MHEGDFVCTNGESDNVTDYTPYDYVCDDWEGKVCELDGKKGGRMSEIKFSDGIPDRKENYNAIVYRVRGIRCGNGINQ